MHDNVKLLDCGVFLKKEEILIAADVHIGYEKALLNSGITLPVSVFPSIRKKFSEMIKSTKPKKIILAGDVKHEFTKPLAQQIKQTAELLEFLKEQCEELIIVKGNHDNFLINITEKMNIKLLDSYETEEYEIIHGHKTTESGKKIIMGHEHPAIELRDDAGGIHKYKCHLLGERMIVLPSVNPLTYGFNVLGKEKPLSPLLTNPEILQPCVSGLLFPKIRDLIQYQYTH